ncbi:MAG: DUF2480 family protein [Capnocytophaga sp.]|nr:DUF2480 family protein [Capnocytophaga sp.]
MADEIVNRVANSSLVVFDLEDYYPEGKRMDFDLKDFLWEGSVLKEKDFREQIIRHDWASYTDAYVALYCTTDAIVPAWSYMLVASKLQSVARRVVYGNREALDTALYFEIIAALDVSHLAGKAVIIKGCSHKPVPESAYVMAVARIQPVAKSVMYGEACSAVPIFKKEKN